jgi:hypothetical protein
VDFDFDKPPSFTTLLIIGAYAFAMLCLACTCTAPFAAVLLHK